MERQAIGFAEYFEELVIDFRDNHGDKKVGTFYGGGCNNKVGKVQTLSGIAWTTV